MLGWVEYSWLSSADSSMFSKVYTHSLRSFFLLLLLLLLLLSLIGFFFVVVLVLKMDGVSFTL
jgi:hypothetical protein